MSRINDASITRLARLRALDAANGKTLLSHAKASKTDAGDRDMICVATTTIRPIAIRLSKVQDMRYSRTPILGRGSQPDGPRVSRHGTG
jgi:hypothetical protein